MPFPDFSAHREGAEDIAQRARAANDDDFLSMTEALNNEPPGKKNEVGNFIFELLKCSPDGPGKRKRRAGRRWHIKRN
jgi:hypothetical protein